MEALQQRAWFNAQLFVEDRPSVTEGGERLDLPVGAVQGEHLERPKPLVIGVCVDGGVKLDPQATIDNAIYSWWTHPIAVNDGEYTWVGGVARMGTVRVARVRPASGAVEMVEISRHNNPDRPDDHNAPALAFEPTQPNIVVIYTGHGYDNVMRYRTLNRTTLALGPERQLTFSAGITYAQVIRSGSRLVLFTRVGSSTWRYRVSDDFGGSWSGERIFMNAAGHGQVYLVVKPVTGDADTNLLAFHGHPVNSSYRDVEFARVRLTSGNVERANGQVVGNLFSPGGPAFQPGDLHPAITPSGGYKVRLLDIGTINGRTVISYAVWQGETGQADYKVKVYRDGTWSTPPWSLATGDPFGHDPPRTMSVRWWLDVTIGSSRRARTTAQASGMSSDGGGLSSRTPSCSSVSWPVTPTPWSSSRHVERANRLKLSKIGDVG